MIYEKLTERTLKSSAKIAVGRIFADIMGAKDIGKSEQESPESAINRGLDNVRSERITSNYAKLINRILQLADQLKINYSQTKVPYSVKNIKEDIVNPNSNFNIAKDILHYKDFVKLMKVSGSTGQKDLNVNNADDKTENSPNPVPIDHTNDNPMIPQEKTGDSFTLRHRKIRYAVHNEDVASADYKVGNSGKKSRARRVTFNTSVDSTELPVDDFDDQETDPVDSDDVENDVNDLFSTLSKKKDIKEDKDPDDYSEEELDNLASKVRDESDILDAYDDDELVILNKDTGETSSLKEEELNEVISRSERMRLAIRFKKSESKRERKIVIALKKHSDSATLNRRARHLALNIMKERLTGKPINQLTIAEKERVEGMLSSRKNAISRLALKLVPVVKKIEQTRLSHSAVTKKV